MLQVKQFWLFFICGNLPSICSSWSQFPQNPLHSCVSCPFLWQILHPFFSQYTDCLMASDFLHTLYVFSYLIHCVWTEAIEISYVSYMSFAITHCGWQPGTSMGCCLNWTCAYRSSKCAVNLRVFGVSKTVMIFFLSP